MANVEHVRITIYGTLRALGTAGTYATKWSAEEWATSCQVAAGPGAAYGAPITPADLAAYATAVGPSVQAAALPLVGVCRSVTAIKYSVIGPDGLLRYAPVIRPVGLAGSGTEMAVVPMPQLSTVLTTIAGTVFRGPGRYGRMYLPLVPPVASGLIATPGALIIPAQTFASSFTSLATGPSGYNWHLAHCPRVAVGPAPVALVDAVRVGDIIDTQRRRRNQALETYSSGYVA